VFILLKITSKKAIKIISFIWLAVSFGFYFIQAAGVSGKIISLADKVLMPYFCAPFAGGMLLAVVAKYKKRDFAAYAGVLLSVVLSFLVQALSYSSLYCAALVFLVLTVELRFLNNNGAYLKTVEKAGKYLKPISFVASVSYPLYLLHQFIGYAIIKHVEAAGLKSEFVIFIPIAISLALAFAVQTVTDKLLAPKRV
ncbi:MAG: hypothetical protein IJU45_08495, partial [Clostridia bacterium]|nr:hypothetical protein [Clostridia bacterium]